MKIYIIIILIIILLFFLIRKYKRESFHNYIFQLSDDKKTKYLDCLQNCTEKNCLKMYRKAMLYDKCFECQKKGMCFSRGLIDGNCNPCQKGQKPMKCNSLNNFGCPNPKNLTNLKGVRPYYIMIDTNNVNYAYDKKCKFCWNI